MIWTILGCLAVIWLISVLYHPLKMTLVALFGGLYLFFLSLVYVSILYGFIFSVMYLGEKLRGIL